MPYHLSSGKGIFTRKFMLRSPLFKRNLVGIYILISRDFGSENCVCRVEMGTISSRFLLWKISLGNSSAINFIRLTLH